MNSTLSQIVSDSAPAILAACGVGPLSQVATVLLVMRSKMNMFIFERMTSKTVATWDKGPTPQAAKIAGALSLTIWLSVLFIARWIGFTKGYDFSIPDNVDIQLNFGQ